MLLTSSYRPTTAKAVWYWHGIRHKDRRRLHSYSHLGFIFVCLVVFNNLFPPLFSSDSWQKKKSSPLNTDAGKLGVHTRKPKLDSSLAFVCLGFCCFGWLVNFLFCLFVFVWRQGFSYKSSGCPWTCSVDQPQTQMRSTCLPPGVLGLKVWKKIVQQTPCSYSVQGSGQYDQRS